MLGPRPVCNGSTCATSVWSRIVFINDSASSGSLNKCCWPSAVVIYSTAGYVSANLIFLLYRREHRGVNIVRFWIILPSSRRTRGFCGHQSQVGPDIETSVGWPFYQHSLDSVLSAAWGGLAVREQRAHSMRPFRYVLSIVLLAYIYQVLWFVRLRQTYHLQVISA